MSSRRSRSAAQHGFSLLEVLVAFAILSLSLGVLLQIFGTSLRNGALAEEYTRATLLGESTLAALGVEQPLTEGEASGRYDDKYRWRTTVSLYEEEHALGDTQVARTTRPLVVTVEVSWQGTVGDRSIALTTLRLVPETQRR